VVWRSNGWSWSGLPTTAGRGWGRDPRAVLVSAASLAVGSCLPPGLHSPLVTAGWFRPLVTYETWSGLAHSAHFLRQESASMSLIGGGGGDGCSSVGKLRMTSSSAPTAVGRCRRGTDLSAFLSIRSHCFGGMDWANAGMSRASSTSRCGKKASRTTTMASCTAF
jgi:hypothetical protein